MNYCIVGTNFISDRFAEALSLCGKRAYAVYSRTEEGGKSFARRHGIEHVFTNYADMLSDGKIDAVYIASPNMCHAEQSIRAMNAGKHVLCEKPIACSTEELAIMMKTAQGAGVILLEAMRPAYDPVYEIIRSSLKLIGRVRRADFEFMQYSSRYDAFLRGEVMNAFNPMMKNSALFDIGIYPLYFCTALFGKPLSVSGSHITLSNGFHGAGTLTLTYPEMLATVSYSKITDSVRPSVIDGEAGSLLIDKMNAPHSLKFVPRGGEGYEIPLPQCDNNMIYEICAFESMCKMPQPEGMSACAERLKASMRVLKIMEKFN